MQLGLFGRESEQKSRIRVGEDGFEITFIKRYGSYTVRNYHLFTLKKVGKEFNVPSLFTRKFRGIPFSILYDFEEERIYLVSIGVRREVVESIFAGVEGLEFEHLSECLDEEIEARTLWRYVAFPLPNEFYDYSDMSSERALFLQSKIYYNPESLADIYNAMKGRKARMLVSFVPASEEELERERELYEEEAELKEPMEFHRKERKVSRLVLLSNVLASMFTTTPVTDLSKGAIYSSEKVERVEGRRDLERRHIARTIVGMCNLAKFTNDAVFRVSFIGYGENSDLLEMHFRSKFPCLKEPVSVTEELTYGIPQGGGDVMSGLFASNFIYFPKKYSIDEERV
ncbi:MAG: hypothetical protein QXF56_00305 [Candidatus Micrarchaeia archaeon]